MADRLPATALRPRTQPGRVGLVAPERSLANSTKHIITELTALVKTRLKRMQHGPACSPASSPTAAFKYGAFL
jgi:hypothetical protein